MVCCCWVTWPSEHKIYLHYHLCNHRVIWYYTSIRLYTAKALETFWWIKNFSKRVCSSVANLSRNEKQLINKLQSQQEVKLHCGMCNVIYLGDHESKSCNLYDWFFICMHASKACGGWIWVKIWGKFQNVFNGSS